MIKSVFFVCVVLQLLRYLLSSGIIDPKVVNYGVPLVKKNDFIEKNEFVGSLLCSERFLSGNSGFPLSTKTNI